jgi:hypothetical protein
MGHCEKKKFHMNLCLILDDHGNRAVSISIIKSLVFITETECVYCAVRTVSMCFVWISEQTAIISLYIINWLVCITETVCLLRGTSWIFKYNSGYWDSFFFSKYFGFFSQSVFSHRCSILACVSISFYRTTVRSSRTFKAKLFRVLKSNRQKKYFHIVLLVFKRFHIKAFRERIGKLWKA